MNCQSILFELRIGNKKIRKKGITNQTRHAPNIFELIVTICKIRNFENILKTFKVQLANYHYEVIKSDQKSQKLITSYKKKVGHANFIFR